MEAFTLAQWVQLVSGAGYLAVSAFLVWGPVRSSAARRFALYLALAGLASLCNLGAFTGSTPEETRTFVVILPYLTIPAPFALLAFIAVYPVTPNRRTTHLLDAVWIVAALAFEIAYFLDHDLFAPALIRGASAWSFGTTGPLSFVSSTLGAWALAVGCVWLLHRRRTQPVRTLRASMFIIALVFLLRMTTQASNSFIYLILGGAQDSLTWSTARFWSVAPLVMALIPVLWTLRSRAGEGAERRALLIAIACFTLGVAHTVFFGFFPYRGILGTGAMANNARAVWGLLVPVLVTLAIVRHGLFGVDLKIKWTISRGTIAAVFLGAFFVVLSVAQNFFSETMGFVAAGIATGLMLLAFHPIQRFGERLAQAAMPNTKSIAQLTSAERDALYREQVLAAYADGGVDRNERRLLETLRARLGLGGDEALAIERDAAA